MKMKIVAAVAVSSLAVMLVGCSTPLSLRGARVMEPGELEVIVSPQVNVDVLGAVTGKEIDLRQMIAPELSARFGVADRVDLQLRLDKSIVPEVSAGYQLVGDPTRDDDVAVSVTAGLKPSWLLYDTLFVSAPLQLLVELPFSDVVAVTGGVRVVPGIGPGIGGVPVVVAISPGVNAGVRFRVGAFVIHPELGVAASAANGDIAASFIGNKVIPRAPLSASLGLNIGGVFDFREKPAAR